MKVIILIVSCFLGVERVISHGFMWDPPNRASMWRFGYDTPINYNDNEYFCGGIKAQMQGDSCGICGDPKADPVPRSNELGGLYGLGIISRWYDSETVVPVTIKLDAEHKGYFQFQLCNFDSAGEESEKCFRPLLLRDGSEKYYPNGTGFHHTDVLLPEKVTCEHCIFRWHYKGGNNWGTCENGTEALGCGPQEIFRSCADVSII